MMAARRRLEVVKSPTTMTEADVLLCKDRAIGHDWPHILRWEDGPDERLAPRVISHVCYRIARCQRCGTERRETFDQIRGWLTKRKNSNRYIYPPGWKDTQRMTQPEIHTQLWKQR